MSFKLICGDIYKTGNIEAYHGEYALLVFQDMSTCFVLVEELTELNSDYFIETTMKVLLGEGLCHTFIVDADSNYLIVFKYFSENGD